MPQGLLAEQNPPVNNDEETAWSDDSENALKREADQSARKNLQEAFTGTINPTEVSFRYRVGLAVIAFMMILLPAIYAGLVGAAGYLVYFHATHHWSILTTGSGGGITKVIIYFGPMIAGIILVGFMVKPFFCPQVGESRNVFSRPRRPTAVVCLHRANLPISKCTSSQPGGCQLRGQRFGKAFVAVWPVSREMMWC